MSKLHNDIKEEFIERVIPDQLLPYVTFLRKQDEEEIRANQENKGATSAASLMWSKLDRYDWFDGILKGLEKLEIQSLANYLKNNKVSYRQEKIPVYISVCPDGNHEEDLTDLEVARKIKETIEKDGHKCLGQGVNPDGAGKPTLEVLKHEVDQCSTVVCIFSKDYFSDSCRMLELLIGLQKTQTTGSMCLVLVLMDDVSPKDIPNFQLLKREFEIVKGQRSRFIRANDDNLDFDNKVLSQLEVDYPVKNIMPAGNIAHGQAWSHYTGFLKYILPNLEEKIKESTWYKEDPIKMSTKFYDIIPMSAKVSDTLQGGHSGFIQYEGKIMIRKGLMRGGTPRDYEVTVWSVEDEDEETYYFAGGYPGVLKAMNDFREELEGDFENQVRRLGYALREITNHANNKRCHNTYRILRFDGWHRRINGHGSGLSFYKLVPILLKE